LRYAFIQEHSEWWSIRWLYLAVVLDLFSRRVIGWSMQSRITKELALDALLMAVWRRKPEGKVVVQIYSSRNAARADIIDYIEMFYNNRRRHSSTEHLSPVEYGRRHQERLGSV
tara:strand:- start:39471 stop:39812 length:342 start_codon:yes stop_codon:yes gene_type:complete